MTRAVPALVFGLAALPGAGLLWSSTFHSPYVREVVSEPAAAVALVLAAAAVGAWLGVPERAVGGGAHGVGVTLAAAVVSRMALLYGVWGRELGDMDDAVARFHVLNVATAVTLALSVIAGVGLAGVAARRRAHENQPDTTSTS